MFFDGFRRYLRIGVFLGKPVLVIRDTTERLEVVTVGTVKLVGADITKITANIAELMDNINLIK